MIRIVTDSAADLTAEQLSVPGIFVVPLSVTFADGTTQLDDGTMTKDEFFDVRFRGREMAHTEIGRDLLTKFAEQCGEVSTMEKSAKMEGRNMSIFLAPKAGK